MPANLNAHYRLYNFQFQAFAKIPEKFRKFPEILIFRKFYNPNYDRDLDGSIVCDQWRIQGAGGPRPPLAAWKNFFRQHINITTKPTAYDRPLEYYSGCL